MPFAKEPKKNPRSVSGAGAEFQFLGLTRLPAPGANRANKYEAANNERQAEERRTRVSDEKKRRSCRGAVHVAKDTNLARGVNSAFNQFV
jgi:hypothetical protein